MKHTNKILAIIATVILSKLSCHAQRVPMHTLTNAVPIPNTITEHKDGTNIIRTQMWRVQEILQILVNQYDESRVVSVPVLVITNPQPVAVKAPTRPPPSVKPTNQLSRAEIMRQERRRQLTNAPAIKK